MKTYQGDGIVMYVEDVQEFLKVCKSGVWFRHSDYPMNDNGAYFKITQCSAREQLPKNVVCLKCASVFSKSESKKEFAFVQEKAKSKIFYGKSLERLICGEIERVWAKNMTERLTLGDGKRFSSYLSAVPNEVFLAPNMLAKMENALERGFKTRMENSEQNDESIVFLGFLKIKAQNVLATTYKSKQREERTSKSIER